MEQIWLESYPAGVPKTIDTNSYSSVVDILDKSCAKFAGKTAYVNMDQSLTYGELDELTRNFASYLQNVLGLHKGDRVAVMMPNLLQYPVAIFGILRAGMVVVNVNPLYTPRELEHQLSDSGARAIVIVENFAHTLEEVIGRTPVEAVITSQLGDMLPYMKGALTNFVVKYIKKLVPDWNIPGATAFTTAMTKGRAQPYNRVDLTHEDVAFLQYTGGTTGLSKGATLTHGNLVANLEQAAAWLSPVTVEGEETIITALPLYHIFALTANCLVFMKLGARNVLITNPRDMPGFVAELKKYPFTAFTGVNTLFNGLCNTPGFDEIDFSGLKFTLGGGAAVQRAVAEQWKSITGHPLCQAYGLTETSPAASMNPIDDKEYSESIGLPLPSTEFSIRDDDNNEVATGESGELCIRGPQVMRGYWQRDDENAKVFTEDGFLRTGDVARCDETGRFYIVDRKKDMILVSGFNVFPNEIEDVVAQHEGVLEVACIGVPDEKSGEAVKIFVVKKNPDISADDIKLLCKEQLTGYKVPKHIEFIDELPKSNVGKILRKDLRARETAA